MRVPIHNKGTPVEQFFLKKPFAERGCLNLLSWYGLISGEKENHVLLS